MEEPSESDMITVLIQRPEAVIYHHNQECLVYQLKDILCTQSTKMYQEVRMAIYVVPKKRTMCNTIRLPQYHYYVIRFTKKGVYFECKTLTELI